MLQTLPRCHSWHPDSLTRCISTTLFHRTAFQPLTAPTPTSHLRFLSRSVTCTVTDTMRPLQRGMVLFKYTSFPEIRHPRTINMWKSLKRYTVVQRIAISQSVAHSALSTICSGQAKPGVKPEPYIVEDADGWSDYLRTHLHPRSMHFIKTFNHVCVDARLMRLFEEVCTGNAEACLHRPHLDATERQRSSV